jgi:hypothetical protein
LVPFGDGLSPSSALARPRRPPAGALPAGPAEPPRADVALGAWERVDHDFEIPKPHAWRVSRPSEADCRTTAAAA